MYPHQHEDPECHHPTLMHLIHHLNEEFLVHNYPVVWSLYLDALEILSKQFLVNYFELTSVT